MTAERSASVSDHSPAELRILRVSRRIAMAEGHSARIRSAPRASTVDRAFARQAVQ
jgi:hypothetical protein